MQNNYEREGWTLAFDSDGKHNQNGITGLSELALTAAAGKRQAVVHQPPVSGQEILSS